MFSVMLYIQQLVLEVSKIHIVVHGKCPVVMSELTEFGVSQGNVLNIRIATTSGDIKFIKLGSGVIACLLEE